MSRNIKNVHLKEPFFPKTENQAIIQDTWNEHHQVLLGFAGTGKTFTALYLAMESILDRESPYDKIIITRSSVPTRDVGFLPGSLDEKLEIYELPYKAIINSITKVMSTKDKEMFADSYDKLKAMGMVEFINTSYLRGLTFDNSIIIFDECQSATYHELTSLATRLGTDSKIVLSGDIAQNDLTKGKSGLPAFMNVISNMYNSHWNITEFKLEDIVRSGFVRDFLEAEYRVQHSS